MITTHISSSWEARQRTHGPPAGAQCVQRLCNKFQDTQACRPVLRGPLEWHCHPTNFHKHLPSGSEDIQKPFSPVKCDDVKSNIFVAFLNFDLCRIRFCLRNNTERSDNQVMRYRILLRLPGLYWLRISLLLLLLWFCTEFHLKTAYSV
jgi:hypothetical protein